ncbi:hypothetical protein Hypma_009134 [Hypsizygus marmoreus]|uniref:Uncharacterized protein n=1 Tax=Hypsizygus marmoreus TaxID=39966 RepID=A0A369JST9_HYPMA|nr:hypothetical protein Hypma_009134 [Hypsizygus marmoreus]
MIGTQPAALAMAPSNSLNEEKETYSMPTSTTRRVYLITSAVKNSRDHWGLYFPSTFSQSKGKVIHVVGAPMMGFKHQIKHYWDMSKSRGRYSTHLLGETDASNIVDGEIADPNNITQHETDTLNAADKFENRASRLPAPGVASAHLWPKGTPTQITAGWARDIPDVRRCQEWTTDFIVDLVTQGLLPETALVVLEAVTAARNVHVN